MMGAQRKRSGSAPEEILSNWFPEGVLCSADRETWGRRMGGWFEGGPEIVREITERLDGWGASLVGIDHPSR